MAVRENNVPDLAIKTYIKVLVIVNHKLKKR